MEVCFCLAVVIFFCKAIEREQNNENELWMRWMAKN